MPPLPLRPDVKGGLFGMITGALALLIGGYAAGAIKIGEAYQDTGVQGAAEEFNRQMDGAYQRGVSDGRRIAGCDHADIPAFGNPSDADVGHYHGGR